MKFTPKHTAPDTNIFSTMTAMAIEHNAVNLAQGFPEFDIDPVLANLLTEASLLKYNQYAPMPGLPALRNAIADSVSLRYGINVDPNTEVSVTPGATYAIYTALAALIEPGDEVIFFEPAYDSYIPNIQMLGGIPKAIPLNSVDFSIDFNLLREAIGAKTKAIIVNTPHNPCGTVISEGDRETLYELIKDTDVVIIADEVYEQLVYTGYTHHSFLAYEALRARTFAIYSFGKVYNNTGWKVGYCIAPPAFTSAFRKIHQYLAFTTNSVAQYALAVYLANHTPAIPLVATMQTARDYFYNAMQATPFKLLPIAAGSYFQLACYEGLSNLGDFEFASLLTSKIGVATIPVSAFYADKTDNKLLRFCFAKSKATLLKATELLQNIDVLV